MSKSCHICKSCRIISSTWSRESCLITNEFFFSKLIWMISITSLLCVVLLFNTPPHSDTRGGRMSRGSDFYRSWNVGDLQLSVSRWGCQPDCTVSEHILLQPHCWLLVQSGTSRGCQHVLSFDYQVTLFSVMWIQTPTVILKDPDFVLHYSHLG